MDAYGSSVEEKNREKGGKRGLRQVEGREEQRELEQRQQQKKKTGSARNREAGQTVDTSKR